MYFPLTVGFHKLSIAFTILFALFKFRFSWRVLQDNNERQVHEMVKNMEGVHFLHTSGITMFVTQFNYGKCFLHF